MDADLLERYALLVVKIGANVQVGQDVYVRADIDHTPVARAIAEQAYLAGAARVVVTYDDPVVRRSALLHAPLESLTSVPDWQNAQLAEMVAKGAASIRLTGNADPHLFDGVDGARLSAVPLEFSRASRAALLSGAVTWTVVAAPNPGWAAQVFGEPDMERLWQAVTVAMRLDEPDVVKAWEDHRAELGAKARAVQALGLDAVRYHGEGSDLTVGLIPGCSWISGALTNQAGIEYMPNLPTEEVFTSPDRRRADGTLRLTRPLVMPRAGVLVEGLVVRFEGGRIVDATADSGQDAILAELDSDEGARSLGEVSLVDRSSRIRKAGVVFHDTLYDENAGCHVAWGQSFPFTVDGGLAMAAAELFELGLNTSSVHTDVVVGGPGVHVDGVTPDGRTVQIIHDDQWVLPVG
jgi:aminopeptidase